MQILTHEELENLSKSTRVIKKFAVVVDVAGLSVKGGKAELFPVGTIYETSGTGTAKAIAKRLFKERGISAEPFGQKRRALLAIDLKKAIASGAVYEINADESEAETTEE